jgi:hypothetical protein
MLGMDGVMWMGGPKACREALAPDRYLLKSNAAIMRKNFPEGSTIDARRINF